MPAFNFPELQFGWPPKMVRGTYLWIWNADKIPPHIGISRGQNYFSLTVRGTEVQKSVIAMVHKARRVEIPLVLVDISDWPIKKDFTSVFQHYHKALPEGPTCLTPLKAVLEISEPVNQLAELLTEIENRGQLKQVFAVHLTEGYRGIPDYSPEDIRSRIALLHETKR